MTRFVLLFLISLLHFHLNAQNVGIGILNPNAKLSVARGFGVDGTAALFGTENVSHFNYFIDENTYIRGGKKNQILYPRGSDVYINDIPGLDPNNGLQPGGHVFLADGGGNVGINGSLAEHAKLEINGRIGATVALFGADACGVGISANNPEIGFNYYFWNGTHTIKAGYAANFGMDPSNGNVYLGNFNGNQSATDFGNISGYQNVMTFKQNGYVGIGTTNPTYPLAVNGTIRSKEIIVEANWADYVFDPKYNLAPLSEVEKYIAQHHHLPNIKSAAEIATDGLPLGEVQSKMMEKIEELTLYIIALNKELRQMSDEINAMKANPSKD